MRTGVWSIATLHLQSAGTYPHGRWPPVVTASIGLATFRQAGVPARLFDNVDATLYRAKRNGRNRIILAQ